MRKRLGIYSLLCMCILSGCGVNRDVEKESVSPKVDDVVESTLGSFAEAETFEEDYDWEEESETIPAQVDVEEITPFNGTLSIDGVELKLGETTFGEMKVLGDYELEDSGSNDEGPYQYKFTKNDDSNWLYLLFSDNTDDGVLLEIDFSFADDYYDNWYQFDGLNRFPTHEDVVTYFGEPSEEKSSDDSSVYIYNFGNFRVYESVYDFASSLRVSPLYETLSFGVNESDDFNGINLKLGELTFDDVLSISDIGNYSENLNTNVFTFSHNINSPSYPDYTEEFNTVGMHFNYNGDTGEEILNLVKFNYEDLNHDYCEYPVYELAALPCGSTLDDAKDYYENVLNLSLADDIWVDLEDVVTYYDEANNDYIGVEYDVETNKILSITYEDR